MRRQQGCPERDRTGEVEDIVDEPPTDGGDGSRNAGLLDGDRTGLTRCGMFRFHPPSRRAGGDEGARPRKGVTLADIVSYWRSDRPPIRWSRRIDA
jgi:hypothetical protein